MTTPSPNKAASSPAAAETEPSSQAAAKTEATTSLPAPARKKPETRRVDTDKLKVSYLTLPAAGAEVIAAALVVNHAASDAPDMLAAIHLTAFIMSVLFIGIYHIAHQVGSRLIRFLALGGKTLLNLTMILVLWDLHAPHKVFVADAFATTEPSNALLAGCLIVAISLLTVLAHFLVVSRLTVSLAEFPVPR